LAGYDDRDIDRVWTEYLELIGDAAESGLFTILGHLDLVKKFGFQAHAYAGQGTGLRGPAH